MGGRQCKQALSTAKETCAVDWQTLIDVVHSGNYVHFVDGKMVLEADYNDKQYELHITSSTADMLISNAKHAVEIREKGGATVRTVPSAAFVFDGPSVLSKVGTVDAFLWTYNEQESKLHTPADAKVLVKHHVTSHKKLNLQELKKTHPEHLWTINVSSTLMSLRSDGPADTTTQKEVEQLKQVIWDLNRAGNEMDSLNSWGYQNEALFIDNTLVPPVDNFDIEDARISHEKIIPLYKELISTLHKHVISSTSNTEMWTEREAKAVVDMYTREHAMADLNVRRTDEKIGVQAVAAFGQNPATLATKLRLEVDELTDTYNAAKTARESILTGTNSAGYIQSKQAEDLAKSNLDPKKAELEKALIDRDKYISDRKKFAFELRIVRAIYDYTGMMSQRVDYDRLKASNHSTATSVLSDLKVKANALNTDIGQIESDYAATFTQDGQLVAAKYTEFKNGKYSDAIRAILQL